MPQHGLMTTYKRLPVTFERGEGIYLFDSEGKRYADYVSGIAVCGLGHCHPAVTRAICEQAGKLVHTSNLYQIRAQQELGAALTAISGMDACFFANSGAEANEAAIKIARLFGNKKGISNPSIIVMDNSFHGRTLATLSATGNRKVQAGFEPLVSGFVRVPFNDVEAVRTVAKNNNSVVAILVEPIQGEGGIYVPADDYLNQLRDICDQHDWLLMLDEIQTGNARTGKYFAFQHNGILPDVVTTAKGLGNGMPIGACLAHGKANLFQPGNHGSTFGGNPLACATGLAVVKELTQGNYTQRAAELGARILSGFKDRLWGADYIKDIRGKGMMFGIELDHPCTELVPLALMQGILLNVTHDNTIRLLPALTMSDAEADEMVEKISKLIKVYSADERTKPRQ
ncbi:MAG TPA: aspartate aminotransferase family protein [Pseudomonadales bacterium]|nr:aspartate aminotransferase family protein [Pseudomonadales bacterium]